MTQEQINQIKSWSEERDVLLEELKNIRLEKDKLLKDCSDLAESKSTIKKETILLEKKIESLNEVEKEKCKSVSTQLFVLMNEKNILEKEIAPLKKELEILNKNKSELELSMSLLVPVYDRVTWQVNQLTDTIQLVTNATTKNVSEVNQLVVKLKELIKTNI